MDQSNELTGALVETDDATDPAFAAMQDLFTFHPPTEAQKVDYQMIRSRAYDLAIVIWRCCPAGPDRTAAIRKLREAVMMSNAAIATHNAAASLR